MVPAIAPGLPSQHLIVVNQVGKRFFNEMLITRKQGGAAFPAGQCVVVHFAVGIVQDHGLAERERGQHQGDV